MNTYAVYMWPRGSLASDIGSDTLFGAVCWAIKVLGLADVDQLLKDFDPPRFAFSSTFPAYRASTGMLRFYPRPAWLEPNLQQIETLTSDTVTTLPVPNRKAAKIRVVENAKRLIGATFVSENIFRDVVSSEMDAHTILRRLTKTGFRPDDIERIGPALITHAERRQLDAAVGTSKTFGLRVARQRNQIDRLAGATAEGLLFYSNELFFGPRGGLWCLLKADSDVVQSLIQPALRYLADTGLGASRTTGKGHFDIHIDVAQPLSLPETISQANGWLTLSRYIPAAGEWSANAQPLTYRLSNLWAKREKRYSHLSVSQSAPIYKRRVRAFEPGSVFPMIETKNFYGRLAVVVPPMDDGWIVYQSGLAIGVRVHLPVIEEK